MDLFDEATLRKLEQLTLVAERVRVGVMKGDRRSSKRGAWIMRRVLGEVAFSHTIILTVTGKNESQVISR